jgi:two-component system OmpR family response regulator
VNSAESRELRRILYVEDDDPIRTVGLVALRTVGQFEVVACASGAEAISQAPTANADLILLDVMMPGMDGPETLGHLRKLPATAATPVVFLTALAQPELIASLRALGAAEVLTKPFEPMGLPEKLRKIWAQVPR